MLTTTPSLQLFGMHTIGKTIQGRKATGLATYCFFLYITEGFRHSADKRTAEKTMENCDQGKVVKIGEEMTEYAKSAVMLDGGIQEKVNILQESAQ